MTHRSLDWPPLQHAFAILDSQKRRHESRTEKAIDIIQAAHDGPTRALKFYNFICCNEKKPGARRRPLSDNEADREIISFYVRYHHLLSHGDTTGSNALIGAWQKKLGHLNLWEDFNLDYESGPPSKNGKKRGKKRARSRPTRASTRKSAGGIPAPKPVEEIDPLPRPQSAEHHYFSDSTLTPLSSSDDEDDSPPCIPPMQPQTLPPSPSRSAVSCSISDLPPRGSNNCVVWTTDQGVSASYTPQDVNMDSEDEPPPTSPLGIGVLVDHSHRGPVNSTPVQSVDDPMNGTSVSAVCLRPRGGPSRSVTGPNDTTSLSAPVPHSSMGRRNRKGRRKANSYPKEPPKRKKTGYVEGIADQPMAIDIPAITDPEPGPEPQDMESVRQDITPSEPFIPGLEPLDPPSLNILIYPSVQIPPLVPETRVPFSTSCANILLSQPMPATILDLSPDDLKGSNDAPAATISGPPRPTLPSNPPIWAQSRQELCESCDFFKSYQGGVYFNNGYAKGYLLSCFGAMRDIWQDGGRLIVSHGGGKAASKLVEADHQSFKDPSVNALVKNWQTKEPLVLIADDKYENFPFDLTRGHDGGRGYAYVVLGYYFIRHYWAERHPADNGQGYAVRFKFAFQYCGEGDPWWTKYPGFSQTLSSPGVNGFPAIYDGTCASCEKPSPQIYEQGWMCLRPSCESHFQLRGVDATTAGLTYTKAFLGARPNPKAKKPAVRIHKPILEAKNGIVTTPLFYHGWHCRRCGRLSCRTKWEHWECSSCGLVFPVKGRIRDHKEFWGLSPSVSFESCDVNPVSGITKTVSVRDQLGTFTFILPHNRGKIHLISGSVRYNTEANEMFKEFQEHANNGTLPFRRFPMKAHICRGEFLTNYFSQNSGEPYQYVGAADKTLPFDQCPPCVLRALELVRARATMMVGERPAFNELLTAAYMEKQSMGFHTDGERGLGPIVASLSMGSPAIMKFRTLEDRKTVVLSLVLRHGEYVLITLNILRYPDSADSVLVMEGATIQGVYEHTVCPIGFRIAVTAREINSENSTQGAWR